MAARFRLLVFDWDGTLMDSIATIVACTQAAVRDIGLEPRPDHVVRSAIGLGLRDSMERFYPGFDEQLYEPLIASYRSHWIDSFRDQPFLFDGAQRTIEVLSQEGYYLGVATAKSRRGLDRELERTGLSPLFHGTRTVDEAPGKPHPGMLLGLMEQLRVVPAETLMIGDTRWDLEMARNAGVHGLGVLSGSHSREELEDCQPLACLASVSEVPNWLKTPS
jgi:phosphoglycolate phosphatase